MERSCFFCHGLSMQSADRVGPVSKAKVTQNVCLGSGVCPGSKTFKKYLSIYIYIRLSVL